MTWHLQRVMSTIPKVPQALIPARRICELLHSKAKIEPDPRRAAAGGEGGAGLRPARFGGHIRFDAVDFTYPTEPSKQVLHGLSFEVCWFLSLSLSLSLSRERDAGAANTLRGRKS